MVRQKTKVKESLTDLQTTDGITFTENEDKANCLNNFFTSVCTREDLSDVPKLEDRPFRNTLEDVPIDEERVFKLLSRLKIDKSPGPDGIHNRVLSEAKDQVTEPLTMIFKASMESGILPLSWKQANVVPIFKKGKRNDPNNYRPVSLTSSSCKLLETLIRDEVIKHLDDNNLLSVAQHGFRSGHSCNTQLMEVLSDESLRVSIKRSACSSR